MKVTRRSLLGLVSVIAAVPSLSTGTSLASTFSLQLGPRRRLVTLGYSTCLPQLAARYANGFIVTSCIGYDGAYQFFTKSGIAETAVFHTPFDNPLDNTLSAVGLAGGKSLIFFQERDANVFYALPVTSDFRQSPEGLSYEMSARSARPIFSDRLASGHAISVWEDDWDSRWLNLSAIATKANAYPPDFVGPKSVANNVLNLLGIRALAGGGAVVSYWARRTLDNAYALHVRLLDSAVSPFGESKVVSSYGTKSTIQGIGVAATANGGFVCVWQKATTGGGILRGRFYSATGVAGTNFSLPLNGYVEDRPSVAETADGNLLTLNIGVVNKMAPRTYNVFATLFSPSGAKLAGPVALDTATTYVPTATSLIGYQDGSFTAAWLTGSSTDGTRRFDARRVVVNSV